ncbi:MAG: hypothetical protein JSV33_09750 [bacterium]|nr:MAG: hypothetical protein JSV33_09750 [bacterium]
MEALAGTFNTLVWHEFADSSSGYDILRRVDDDEVFVQIGQNSLGDTFFIDTDVYADHTYHYRIISTLGDTLRHTNESSSGLREIAEMVLPSDFSVTSSSMTTDGHYVYLASGSTLMKIDVSDPHNPVTVAERSLSSLYISDFALNDIGCYLVCVSCDQGLFIIDVVDQNLPVVGHVNGFSSCPDNQCRDVAVEGDMAYVACERSGIVAVNISMPTDPVVWGTYLNPDWGNYLKVRKVKVVNDHLYISGHTFTSGQRYFSEIIKPLVNESQQSCIFSVECSNVVEPFCLDQSLHLEPIKDGAPRGYYSLGTISDTTFTILNTSDVLNPTPIKTFKLPFWVFCVDTHMCDYMYRSYDFDDQYLYISGNRWKDWFDRGLYAYDIHSIDSLPEFAIGDTTGYSHAGSVLSWGRYVYYGDVVYLETPPLRPRRFSIKDFGSSKSHGDVMPISMQRSTSIR